MGAEGALINIEQGIARSTSHRGASRTGMNLIQALAAASASTTGLRGELELGASDAAQFEKTHQRFFDQIVRTGSAGGDADDDRTGRQPIVRDRLRCFSCRL